MSDWHNFRPHIVTMPLIVLVPNRPKSFLREQKHVHKYRDRRIRRIGPEIQTKLRMRSSSSAAHSSSPRNTSVSTAKIVQRQKLLQCKNETLYNT